jgi:hypothetical protein
MDFAHLRFADDVFAVVTALQAVRPVSAKDARDVFEGAPEGWFVIVMEVPSPLDLIGVVATVSRAGRGAFDDGLLMADVVPEGDHFVATFLNLRGQRQSVH